MKLNPCFLPSNILRNKTLGKGRIVRRGFHYRMMVFVYHGEYLARCPHPGLLGS